MRAVTTLLLRPWRRSFVLCTLALVSAGFGLTLGALAFESARGRSGLPTLLLSTLALGSAIWHVAAGMALASVCRPESFLMPRFRSALMGAAVLDVSFAVLGPTALIAASGGGVPFAAAGLLLASALGLSVGLGSRIGLWVWLAMVASSFAPGYAKVLLDGFRSSRL